MLQAPKHVYVHIPFCSNKCYYCDFNIFVWQGDEWVTQYLDALERELMLRVQVTPPNDIHTIYIGGGTPSILSPAQMDRLFATLARYFPNRSKHYEMTVEVNPGTLTADKCIVMRDYGVNRLSIGVQSFTNRLLRQIGRQHTAEDAIDAVQLARKHHFDNISLDLIYGLPEQSMTDFKASLTMVQELDVDHLSSYNLRIEEKTIFHLWQQQQRIQLPAEDLEVEMYHTMIDTLASIGLEHYEISNFARRGKQSRHNLAYWLNREYYGIGAGAHGYIQRTRYENIGPIKRYMKATTQQLPVLEQHLVKTQERIEEMLFLGLRLNEGVTYARFGEEIGGGKQDLMNMYAKEIEQLVQLRLLEADEIGIRLTPQGRLLSNEVFARFLLDA